MAMAELGCQHVTISRANMKTLMTTPDNLPPVSVGKPEHPYANLATSERLKCLSGVDLLAGRSWNGTPPSLNVEYLANGGEALNAAIDRDSVARKRLTDAMNMFIGWEEKAKAIICQEAASIGISVVTRDDPSSADENSKRETGRRTHSLI